MKRRYDIDWIRVIAIALLLVYHTAIGFQPWGVMIGFITTDRPWPVLWVPMTLLNVWRIPLLFFVSGMGVYFALRRRTWPELLRERARRILLPFMFGAVTIVPLHIWLLQWHYGLPVAYVPNPGHLWFLGNLFAYVVLLCPLLYFLKRSEGTRLHRGAAALLRTPMGLLPIFVLLVAEAIIIDPVPFELYAMTWHGFLLGLLAFLSGFVLVWSGPTCWQMLLRWRWALLVMAAGLFTVRLNRTETPSWLLSVESTTWVLTVFAFGHRYLNHPGKALRYLSEAAYPVYILHMVFLYLGSLLVFRFPMGPPLQFGLVLIFTTGMSIVCYELIIRRLRIFRALFGLKAGNG